jgi:peptide-methionine (S)-S-oxide reductase
MKCTPFCRIVVGIALVLALAGASLSLAMAAPKPHKTEQVVLAGGCFWGMEAVFRQLRGVVSVMPGYSGGNRVTAEYELVSTGMTGHAESVEITFDPSVISLRQLLDVDFTVAMDPTEKDYQGPDHGSQYRSVIFFSSPEQQAVAQATIADYERRHVFDRPIVTEVVPLRAFYPAEPYHRNYVALHPDNPYVAQEDLPKLAALRQRYPALVAAR